MPFSVLPLLFSTAMAAAIADSYTNPNPRPYEKCLPNDLVKLLECCNGVLAKLDDCKANDLACECCALQSMDALCFGLCPNNPSNNFLTVLFNDCASLNDVNACGLPFKKEDLPKEVATTLETDDISAIVVKSRVRPTSEPKDDVVDLLAIDPQITKELGHITLSTNASTNASTNSTITLRMYALPVLLTSLRRMGHLALHRGGGLGPGPGHLPSPLITHQCLVPCTFLMLRYLSLALRCT